MGDVFHFIIVVQDVDAGVHQLHVGAEFCVACVQHVGEQGHSVLIARVGDVIVLVCQPNAVFLCSQVGKGR